MLSAAVLDEPEPVLELGQPKLELLVLLARHEAKLNEERLQTISGAFGDPRGVSAPPPDRVVEQLPRVLALHHTSLAELRRELVDSLRRQRDSPDGRKAEPLDELPR